MLFNLTDMSTPLGRTPSVAAPWIGKVNDLALRSLISLLEPPQLSGEHYGDNCDRFPFSGIRALRTASQPLFTRTVQRLASSPMG